MVSVPDLSVDLAEIRTVFYDLVGDHQYDIAGIRVGKRLHGLEPFMAKLNHSAGAGLAQDQGIWRRPYRVYGRAEARRDWAKHARPFGFPAGRRPLCRPACPMSPHRVCTALRVD